MDYKHFQVSRTSIADQITDLIKQEIVSGTWKVGERIPSENQLAELFNVNRLTIRIAIQKLNAMGVLETRSGSGTYVIPFDLTDYIREAHDFYLEPDLMDHIYEYRKTIEIESARLAIERATEEDLAEFKNLLDVYQDTIYNIHDKPTDEDINNVAIRDIDFHRHICKMSHNKFFLYSFTISEYAMYKYIAHLNKNRFESFNMKKFNIFRNKDGDIHNLIYDAIIEKDFEKCKKYYLTMLDPSL